MKRSEMLDLMWRELVSKSTINETSMDKCERLLRVIEESGMKPPAIKNPRYDSEKAEKYIQHPFLEYDQPYYVNEWEK